MRDINKKFKWLDEARENVREIFKNIQEGYAYYGRIVVKKQFIGYDTDYNMVEKYTNKGHNLYIINRPYDVLVTSVTPELSH